MKKLFIPVYLLLIAAALSSCSSKGPKEAKLIPKNAIFVSSVDAGSLKSKLEALHINYDSLFNSLFTDDPEQSKHQKIFKDFQNCGIVWNSSFFVFATSEKLNDNTQSSSVNLLANITDSAKLYAFIHQQEDLKYRKLVNEKNYSYLPLNNNTVISWTDKNVIITYYNQTSEVKLSDTLMHTGAPVIDKTEELKKLINKFYTQKESESIASVTLFTDLYKEKADAYMFNSTNTSIGNLSMLPLQLPKMEELLKDNFSTATFSFEDGKITAQSNFYPNKILGAIFKQYAGPTVNTSMIESYPTQHLNGFLLASFNPAIIDGILKELEVDALLNATLDKANITSADIYKCLKGEINVAVSDLRLNNMSENTSSKLPFIKVILDAPVGDKASFMKLMDKAAASGFVYKHNNTYSAGGLMSMFGIYLHADEKSLVIASDSLTYLQYTSKGGKSNISNDILEQVKGKSFAFYANIESITESINSGTLSADDSTSVNTLKNTFKDVIATSNNYDGTKINSRFNLRFKNEKQNSLVTLMSLFTHMGRRLVQNATIDENVDHFLFLDPSMGSF